MPLPISIDSLIEARGVEQSRIEYKRGWNPDECIRTLCAFANDIDNQDGGYIVLGVEEESGRPKLPVVGLDPASLDRVQKDLLNKCHFIEPFYFPRVEVCEHEGKTLVVLWARAGDGRPYRASKYATKNQSDKAYYVRRGSSSVAADDYTLRELFEQSSRIPYDDRENPFADVADLSLDLMREHLHRVGSSLYELSADMPAVEVARDMGLVSGPAENPHPKNVALLMFSDEAERFFPFSRIEVVDLPDPTGADMVEKTFAGPLQRQLADALEYLRNYMLEERVGKVEGQIETRRAWNYPLAAVKEVLANAVYHRDYQIPEPVTVVRTPAYLEIRSFPGFDRSITDQMIADLQIRSAGRYRNRRIGNFLKELGLTEGRNTGIPTAVRSLAANGSGKPLFMTDAERQSLTVRIPVHPAFLEPGTRGVGVRPGKRNRSRDELRHDVLVLLTADGFSASALARELGYSGVSQALRQTLEDLVEEGLVRSSGAGRSRRYTLVRPGR